MMKHLVKIFFIILIGGQLVTAQQDPMYSQNMFNMAAYNPGYVGSNDMVCLSAIARQQWTGIEGAPQTSFFNANMPVRPFGISSGIGISILNDVYGFNNDLGLNFAYAYRMDAGDGKLGIGASFGVLNSAIDASDWKVYHDNGTIGSPDDANFFPTSENPFIFDMSFGLFYRLNNMYMGLSSTHILEPSITYKEASIEPYVKRHYYITSGYNLQLGNPLFEVIPSFLVQSDGKVSQLALNTNILYNKKIWGGVSYRVGDALIGMLGLELFNGLRVGYAYDFEMNALREYAGGSHELFIGYCFSLKVDKEPQQYKSIRFL
ncbi:MAG: type IX secretion system membrane protein PorP/SprF [Bacteroidales bacterium]|nr:type IX secretion system membrane protein PorP/SprF [Bacteroidales bacterium]